VAWLSRFDHLSLGRTTLVFLALAEAGLALRLVTEGHPDRAEQLDAGP
jgi:hypothetical protein